MTTPKPFNPVVTEAAVAAASEAFCNCPARSDDDADKMIRAAVEAALAHPDFQRQLREYAASVARQMVPDQRVMGPSAESVRMVDRMRVAAFNACRAATLSAIDEWEKNV